MAETPNRSERRIGTLIKGKYLVEALIATGTMANVYSATHRNGSRVALKVLHDELSKNAALAERFKREGYFANSVGHPGVVRAIDDDVTDDGSAFLVMELLDGENLDDFRKRLGGKVALADALVIADAVLDVLAAAHARDVVHRDIKPENVFVTASGDIKVLDFGVARYNDGNDSSDMTAVGMVLGTPAFMPPEQALGRREEVDAQSDIWALGATLFLILTGESVHAGGNAKAKLIATARTPARPLRDVAPEVPRTVAAAIDRALSFEKHDRWPDAHSMREALRWARMSLTDTSTQMGGRGPAQNAAPPAAPTRRVIDDEPTIARGRVSIVAEVVDSERTAPSTQKPVLERPQLGFNTLRSEGPPPAGPSDLAISLRREKARDDDEPPTTEPHLAAARSDLRYTQPMPVPPPRPAAGAPAPDKTLSSGEKPADWTARTPAIPNALTNTPRVPGAYAPTTAPMPATPVPAARPSAPAASDRPGPLLSQVAPSSRGRGIRVAGLVGVAMIAGFITYLGVMRHRASAHLTSATPDPTVPPSDTAPDAASKTTAAAVTNAPATTPASSTNAHALPDAPVANAAPSAAPTEAASREPRRHPRPRVPRPPPRATASAALPVPARPTETGEAPAEPPAIPVPAPDPTPAPRETTDP